MLVSLALGRMLRRRGHARTTAPRSIWYAIWQARLDRLEKYLHQMRQQRKAQ